MKHFYFKSIFLSLLMMVIGGVGAYADTSALTFTKACGGSGTADDGAAWAVTSDASESNYDGTKGIHYGTGKKAVSYLQLSTSDIDGTITKIVVNASGASGTSAKLNVTVGGNSFGEEKSLTSTATDYTFEGNSEGDIIVKLSQTSETKALYVKSIVVTYTTGGDTDKTLTSISVSGHTTSFNVGDDFSFGGTVTATYDDESTKDIPEENVTFSGYDMSTAGDQTVTVSYTEGGETKTTTYNITVNAVAVTRITLDKEEATILVGITKTLKATIEPANATDKTVIWTSSDEDVATVDENGVVTAVAEGTATITATSNENDEITATCAVTVVSELNETTATGNLNNSDSGVFVGIGGFTNGGHNITGTLATAVGDVTVNYAGTTNTYLDKSHIRMYSSGSTLKFTAPSGFDLTKIVLTISAGNADNIGADKGTYTKTEDMVATWTGAETAVTFIGQNTTTRLAIAEVTLEKAAPKSPLASIRVEGYKTDFVVGDTYTFDGTVTAVYEDGTEKDVTNRATFTEPDMTTAGEDVDVTVSYTEGEVTAEETIYINVREPETITFRKVSSTGDLKAGKRYMIVNEEYSVAMAACSDASSTPSYFHKNDVTFSVGRVTLEEGKANFLTLGGESDAWTFATSIESGKYLAYTGGGNYLESGASAEAASAQWTIEFDGQGNAAIKNNYKTDRFIMYNSGSNPKRFACYTGTQRSVQLYVEVDEDDVDLTISSVGFATLYYSDRALKVPEGVTAKTYKVVDGKLAESKTYEAGKVIPMGEAVVLKGAEGDYTFFASSTAEPKDADNQLKGSDEAEETTGGNYYYALQAKSKDGKHGPGMYWMNSTGAPFENGAHKAYMALDEKFAGAQGMAKEFYLFVEATTGISGIDAASADRTEMYNLNGQRVDRGYKGVVIKNGKKIVRK